jgi:hypothetical protein
MFRRKPGAPEPAGVDRVSVVLEPARIFESDEYIRMGSRSGEKNRSESPAILGKPRAYSLRVL